MNKKKILGNFLPEQSLTFSLSLIELRQEYSLLSLIIYEARYLG